MSETTSPTIFSEWNYFIDKNKMLGVWLKTEDSYMQFYLKIITFILGCITLWNSVKKPQNPILDIKILFLWKQLPLLKPSQDLWKKDELNVTLCL